MQLILLVTPAKDQTQKYFHFFIRQYYTSQTRTESALTLLSLKVTLRNNSVTVVHVSYCLCSIEHRCFHINTACMNQNATIIKSQKATTVVLFSSQSPVKLHKFAVVSNTPCNDTGVPISCNFIFLYRSSRFGPRKIRHIHSTFIRMLLVR